MTETWHPKPWHPEALAAAIDNPKMALWMKMGLGKTVIAATAVRELMDRAQVNRTLIVGPVRVIESVWPAEMRKWEHLTDLPFRLVRGSMKHRGAVLDTPWHGVELLSYETLTWAIRDHFRRRPLPWQMLILDEADKLKRPGSQRFRAMRHRCAEFTRVLELAGSPVASGLVDLWGPIFLMDQGERLGRVYSYRGAGGSFLARWFRTKDSGWGYEPLPHAEKEIRSRVSDVALSMRIEDYVDDLPPLVETDVWGDLPGKVADKYAILEKEMYLQLERGEVEAANGGVLTSKTRQLANGAMYLDGGKEWEEVHTAKLDALAEVVSEQAGAPLIVCYQFRSDLARLKKRYPRAATLEHDSPRIIDEWNRGEHELLLIHPASAGHGINLQDGGDSMAFFGLGYSFGQYEQACARIAGGLRRKRPTFIYRVLTRGTIDETVLYVLRSRCTVQEALFERMRRRQNLPAVA